MLLDFLVRSFTVDEIRNFLGYHLGGGAALLVDLPDGSEISRMNYMSALVDLLARTGRHDRDFFASLHRARPRLRTTIEELQRHFSADTLPMAVDRVLDVEGTMTPVEIDERNEWWDTYGSMVQGLDPARRFEVQRLNSLHYLERFGVSVRELKGHLSALGYYAGIVDDDFDDGLVDAVVRLQRRQNMRHVDGIIGELTLQKIFDLLGRARR